MAAHHFQCVCAVTCIEIYIFVHSFFLLRQTAIISCATHMQLNININFKMYININDNKYSLLFDFGGSVMGAGRFPQPRIRTWGKVRISSGTAVVTDVGVCSWWNAMGKTHPGRWTLTCKNSFWIHFIEAFLNIKFSQLYFPQSYKLRELKYKIEQTTYPIVIESITLAYAV